MTADLAQVNPHGIKRLADLRDIGDELLDGYILLALDLFFELGVAFDARDRRAVFFHLRGFRLFEEVVFGFWFGFTQMDVFIQLAFGARAAPWQRGDEIEFFFRIVLFWGGCAWLRH